MRWNGCDKDPIEIRGERGRINSAIESLDKRRKIAAMVLRKTG